MGRVWWLKAFSFIELPKNPFKWFSHVGASGLHLQACLPKKGEKNSGSFCLSSFLEVVEMGTGLQTAVYSVHTVLVKNRVTQVTAEATLSFYRDVLV